MRCKRIGAISAMMAVAVWSSLACAQPASPATDPSRSQATALEREQSNLQQQIADKQRQLQVLRDQPAPEQAELTAARQAVEQARAAHRADPGAGNEAKLKNAEFKLTLVERKYNKATTEADALAGEIEQLQQQLAASRRRSASLSQQAAEQQSQQSRLQAQRLAEERAARDRQQQELARSRQEAEEAQREIERLKALLAQKESTAAPAAKPAAAAAPKPAPASAAAAVRPATTSAAGVLRLASQKEVLQELRTLELRLVDVDARSKDVNEILYLKRLQGGKEVGKSMLTLKSLGHQQYRGASKIEAGQFQLVLGPNSWPAEFSAAESGASYVFLYDNSDAKKPRLLMYNSALEGGN